MALLVSLWSVSGLVSSKLSCFLTSVRLLTSPFMKMPVESLLVFELVVAVLLAVLLVVVVSETGRF